LPDRSQPKQTTRRQAIRLRIKLVSVNHTIEALSDRANMLFRDKFGGANLENDKLIPYGKGELNSNQKKTFKAHSGNNHSKSYRPTRFTKIGLDDGINPK
jgi:hypothetical protein